MYLPRLLCTKTFRILRKCSSIEFPVICNRVPFVIFIESAENYPRKRISQLALYYAHEAYFVSPNSYGLDAGLIPLTAYAEWLPIWLLWHNCCIPALSDFTVITSLFLFGLKGGRRVDDIGWALRLTCRIEPGATAENGRAVRSATECT